MHEKFQLNWGRGVYRRINKQETNRLGEWRLYQTLPSYRSPTAIKINELFLLDSIEKQTILRDLQIGFLAE